MDKEHAKFILDSFRPDGADANNPEFSEALQLAAEDRELGSWLSQQRAHDSAFSEALYSAEIPDGLREEIMAAIDQEKGGITDEMPTEIDALFVGAMAHISPPEGLRSQILSAMEVEHNAALQKDSPKKIVKFPSRWMNVAAIAAILVLSAIFIFPGLLGSSDGKIKLVQLQVGSGKIINASHEVDVSENTLSAVNTWFVSQQLPEALTVPEGLIKLDVKGGKKLVLDNGVEASMVFFKEKGKSGYFLMILDINALKAADKLLDMEQIELKNCWNCPVTRFNVTAWKDSDKAYMLLSKAESYQMAEMF